MILIAMRRFCFLTLSIFFSCIPEIWMGNSKKALPESINSAVGFVVIASALRERQALCNDGIIFYASVGKRPLGFFKGKVYINLLSDKISKLNLHSEKTLLDISGSVLLSKTHLLYEVSGSAQFYCSDLSVNEYLVGSSSGYFQVSRNSNTDISVSFDRTGYYLLFLDTGDPNFNPTDIYAVME